MEVSPCIRTRAISWFTQCLIAASAVGLLASLCATSATAESPPKPDRLDEKIVVTQIPSDMKPSPKPSASGMLRADYTGPSRLVMVAPSQNPRVLTGAFYAAADPDVSFDAKRILFAGKPKASDRWNVYEMGIDGSNVRQITRDLGDCRSPRYQSALYTIVSPEPWYQITFVSNAPGTLNETGDSVATHLYSCKPDGSSVRRLTFNLSSDMDPFLMSDGRLLFAAWQRSTLTRGDSGRVALFGVNIDGADYALYADKQTSRVRHMPCETTGGLVVFVESDKLPWDGAGTLGAVTMRRPLHSYRSITKANDGFYVSPSPLPDGKILAARRPADGRGTHGIVRLDPKTGKFDRLFDDSRYHDIQPRTIAPRKEPDGRSSVVTEKDPYGKLYCLNININDLKNPEWMPPGTAKRLRVLEGIPAEKNTQPVALAQRRLLGEIDIEKDGSFNVEIPASTSIELQLLDDQGMALRGCSWIWAKNHEPRGCIGCHEDGELTPENVFVDAVQGPAISLCLPEKQRRCVDFRRDVMPIIEKKCVPCHGPNQAEPRLDGPVDAKTGVNRAYKSLLTAEPSDDGAVKQYKYVTPGQARTSPMIWHVFGRNTSRCWDGETAKRKAVPIPEKYDNKVTVTPLTADEQRTLVEWIDFGAAWDGIPDQSDDNREGDNK